MKISDLLLLDCRDKKNLKMIVNRLEELPAFREEAVSLDNLEKFLTKIENKYPICLGYILRNSKDRCWSAMIKETGNHQHLATVYGISLFEILAKSTLYLYAYIKKNFKK
jgi:hypothetical protein